MSRHDLDGFFWNDAEREARGKREITRALPPFPETGWTPPKEFPDLRHAKLLAIDTETKDPFLKERGSGVREGSKRISMHSLLVLPISNYRKTSQSI